MKRQLPQNMPYSAVVTSEVEVIDVESFTYINVQSTIDDAARDDTDVEIIEPAMPPKLSPSTSNAMKSCSEEVQILHSNTVNALNAYTHPRFLCALYPFTANPTACRTGNRRHCPKCFCYICQIEVIKCKKWNMHCNANGETSQKLKKPPLTYDEVIDVDEESDRKDSESEYEATSVSENGSSSQSETENEITSESKDGASVEPNITSRKLPKRRGGNNKVRSKRTNNSAYSRTAVSFTDSTGSKHETNLTKTKLKSTKQSIKKGRIQRTPKPKTQSNMSLSVKSSSNSNDKKKSTKTKTQANKQSAKKGTTAAGQKRRKISSS